MIEAFEDINRLFEEIDQALDTKAHLYIIGGAMMLYHGLKDATKDIDWVVRTQEEFATLMHVLPQIRFEKKAPGMHYDKFNLSFQLARDDFQIDMFCKTVCAKLRLSEEMMQRSEQIHSGQRLGVSLVSTEDVFVFKCITTRPGDIEDSISLARSGLDWDIILEEITAQIEAEKEDIWITWFEERLNILEDRGVEIPILAAIRKLSQEYLERRYS